MIQRFPTKPRGPITRAALWLWGVYNRHHWLTFGAVAVMVALINLWRGQ